jgi:hypothetical protein
LGVIQGLEGDRCLWRRQRPVMGIEGHREDIRAVEDTEGSREDRGLLRK